MEDLRKEMGEQPEDIQIDLYQLAEEVWKNLRRMWWIAVLFTVAGAGIFSLYQYIGRTPMYESTATFTVATGSETGSYGFYYDSGTADQMAKTFPYILESSYFQSVLRQETGMDTLNGTVTAEIISGSNVVTMRAQSPDARDAYTILNAAIDVYPDAAHFVLGDISFTMLTEPDIASEPYNRVSVWKSIAVGGCAGLAAAVVILILLAFFRKNVCSTDEMKKITSVRCLASIPRVRFKARSENKDTRVTFRNKKISYGYSESIRTMKNRVVRDMEKRKAKVLLVTSTAAGEGKSVTAVNLAQSLVGDGYKVLFVDGDLRKQNDAVLLDTEGTYGLADVARVDDTEVGAGGVLAGILQNSRGVRDIGLWFLGGAEKTEQPAPVLSSDKLEPFFLRMREKMDYIIIDTPPCTMFQDASILAEHADCVLYVVQYDRLPLQKIREGLLSLGGKKTAFAGYVFNDCPESTGSYGYGRYGYGRYGYGRYGYGRYGYGGYDSYDGRNKEKKEKKEIR